MAGAAPDPADSGNSSPNTTTDTAAGISIAIVLLVVLGLAMARRSGSRGAPGARREAGRDGLVASLRVVRYRAPRADDADHASRDGDGDGDVDVEAGPGLSSSSSATRRPPARLWTRLWRPPTRARRPRPPAPTACPICTDDFVGGSRLCELPCGHLFHPPCVGRWLSEFGVTCPLCRADLTAAAAANAVPVPRKAVMAAIHKLRA